MNDDDIERLLARARPIGPSGELRARIFARRPAGRVWPWAAAAAAMLALSTLLQSGATAAREGVRAAAADRSSDAESELIAVLRETGGLSEAEARLVAMTQQMEMRIAQNRPGAQGSER